jgi:hypothetical protein
MSRGAPGQRTERAGLRRGLVLLLAWHTGAFLILSLVAILGGGGSQLPSVLAILGLTIMVWQWIYVLPLVLLLAWKRRWPVLRGVLLGALITTLVNGAACFGVMR